MNSTFQITARSSVLTLTGIMLVALNLRPGLTSVSPVLTKIGDALTLSPADKGVLTTLPVLFLGLAAPIAPRIARRFGIDRAVLATIVILAVALMARPYLGTSGLFGGTILVGSCIGVLGVLLPGIVKREYPQHASLLTGIYTAALCLGASLAAGITEPIRMIFQGNWQPSLMVWAAPAILAALVWNWQSGNQAAQSGNTQDSRSLLRDPLAWQVTLYMGFQSSLAYSIFGWWPTILQDRGLTPVDAGLALSTSIMIQVGSAIAAPWLSSMMRDERTMTALAVLLMVAGIVGCIFAPIAQVWLWIVFLGLGQGAAFSMALTLIAVRARDSVLAARLSGMAQGVGYSMAALGPLAIGLLNNAFDNWRSAGLLLVLVGVGAFISGLAAGRDRFVGDFKEKDVAVSV